MTAVSVWDPFEGVSQVSAGKHQTIRVSPHAKLFRYLKTGAATGILIGFAVLFYSIFTEASFVPGAVITTLCFAALFAVDHISGAEANRTARLGNAVLKLGYLGGGKIQETRLGQVKKRAQALFRLRVGGSIPLVITHEFWGKTEGIPFWAGTSVGASTALFGGPKANVVLDTNTVHGEFTMVIVAYRLDRDTRVHVEIMPEFVTTAGPLDRDIKTESAEFNSRYNIRLTLQDGAAVDERKATSELLQVLTPAFQSVLIDLAEAYAARVVVDRDTVFFAGYRNMQGTDEGALAGALEQTLHDFARAAISFKRYAE